MVDLFNDINIHLTMTGFDPEKRKKFETLISQLKNFPDLASKMTPNEQNLMKSFELTIQNLQGNASIHGQAFGKVEVTQMQFKA